MKRNWAMYGVFASLFLLLVLTLSSQAPPFLLKHWIAEDQSGAMQISVSSDTVDVMVPDGLTLWYNHRLQGDYEISYHIAMVMKGGEHDRLSDLNCFWAANDPQHPHDLFARKTWRNGIFHNYNTLNLFYVGYGGNDNTTTRFRYYRGEYYGVDDNQVKPLLREYTDAAHLLVPNAWYHIVIRVSKGYTTYSVNGEELFRAPLAPKQGDGYFGLRLLQNHILFTGFEVKQLASNN